jgi:MFS family permease
MGWNNLLRQHLSSYPRQFWLLFGGHFFNQASSSLIWPFLTIFMRERLNESLTTITLLFTIQAISGLGATSIIGSLMDRFGRKGIMIAGLLANAGVMIAMSRADRFEQWIVLSALYGAVTPIFSVGANAMVADLVEPARRVNAYALLRIVSNLGLAFGPILGGRLASNPAVSFHVTAVAFVLLAGMIALFLAESLRHASTPQEQPGSYLTLLRDRMFMAVFGLSILIMMGATLVFRLMPIYIKENYGIAEDQFGLIVTVNAVMVVLFQYGVTRISRRFKPLPVLTLGAFIYALGVGSVALGGSFAAFVVSMMIVTCGELLVAPTSTALVANLAPPDMRARYMGLFSITYMIAGGTGPVLGGFLADHVGPSAIWYGGALVTLIAALGFWVMARSVANKGTVEVKPVAMLQEQ